MDSSFRKEEDVKMTVGALRKIMSGTRGGHSIQVSLIASLSSSALGAYILGVKMRASAELGITTGSFACVCMDVVMNGQIHSLFISRMARILISARKAIHSNPQYVVSRWARHLVSTRENTNASWTITLGPALIN